MSWDVSRYAGGNERALDEGSGKAVECMKWLGFIYCSLQWGEMEGPRPDSHALLRKEYRL